ncbi:probable monoterpene synthase MTS1, chloroplastic [Cannabis sativa]|uniref:probable monoterpene synthase MTS1, chloroplastic n=1 Tax=Cannabis sativa TaxID=3483 RepID=UPI0029CA70A7|nr:probable monoterpene synthase MTS1, chloroplastic [Cannabis sativa]
MTQSGVISSSSTPIFKDQPAAIVRRSGNYKPTLWDAHFFQSLQVIYTEESYGKRISELKEDVRRILEKETENPLVKLEQINDLSRLGISYHFEDQIKTILNLTFNYNNASWKKDNLYATALHFKLLRQYGFSPVSSEVFNAFKDEKKEFKESLSKDVKGMVCLYEASFYSFRGEPILDEARDFTTKHLKQYLMTRQGQTKSVDHHDDDHDLVKLVEHALDLPLHWRLPRLEARWFIDMYAERNYDMTPTFLDFAKLDYNFVQSAYQKELKYISRWWSGSRLTERLPFARDRVVEIFYSAVALKYEAEFGFVRTVMTKIGLLLTLMDDIYDVYGTLDELQLFLEAIERWNINELDQLPDYMKILFVAFYNNVNEISYYVLKENGIHTIKYLKKALGDLCKCYMEEAKWFHSGHIPSLEEFIENGWKSITIPLCLIYHYCLITTSITEQDMEHLLQYPTILRVSGTIFRFIDDLGTSSDELERGDNPSSIQCYMREKGVSENESREHIWNLISEGWKEINEVKASNSPYSQVFIESAIDFVRGAMEMYHKGDGFGTNQDRYLKTKVVNMFFDPIPI